MVSRDGLSTALRWVRRLLLVAVLSYLSYSMLLMGYILLGTSCQPYGQEHFYFYRMGGSLLLLGGLAILALTVRWLSRVLAAGRSQGR